ncbi:cation:proton antiporter [Nocardia farcinica]|uniref:Sodium, potassium, lithium and rubidium/H(+) antiporter n=1 Tax=Nocardia farcinica TaxID=37329 RepID=A0A0H5NSJ6_NOCFR|nr:cation:proton antiporter [Nocardia farcinica]AXK85907.1 sodium:proton antiporter [Nocardia farcinica]MBA4859105.1 cation:proton antiporter [Nocardia farcinica]MBC9818955.1 cation:proton antiporter [Nocardia farcinica]MBF6140503.1 cation:proton antiporter [Nocardia farcinica]MBF6252151.1 cation:proton antiporter [Nocardia farcinica]
MAELLIGGVVMLIVIAGAATVGPKLGVAAPLILVAVGIVGSVVPFVPEVEIDPEWVLEGLLPPLLYSSAVAMPTMNFRRDFGAIGGLSVVLVVLTAVTLGVFFAWAIPGLSLAWGIALGAVISPTDAVATSIIRQAPVPRRVVAILDGESLLNDATALVLLRTAIAATAAAFSFGAAVGTFAWSVLVAVVVGGVVGWANLAVRHRVADATVNTVISFTVPFVASVPTELLGGSGLVAAVVAGIVTGYRAPRMLSARHRLSDSQNWRTIEVVLEGIVFLTMGLHLSGIVAEVHREHAGIGSALLVAVGALVLGLLVRAGYVGLLLAALAHRARRSVALQPRIRQFGERLARRVAEGEPAGRSIPERRVRRAGSRVRRALADIDYFLAQPLGPREGFVVVLAGMRGAITVAAAQTLPADTPNRPLLIFVAFAVATLSLLCQGATVGPLVRRLLGPARPGDDLRDERASVLELLRTVSAGVPRDPSASPKQHRLAVLSAQRAAILDARDDGAFDAEVLQAALSNIDAAQIALEMRGGPV